jgi:ActR/RegA family two-component response regulator
MPQGTLLIIDADRATRNALQGLFISRGWEVALAATQHEGQSLLSDYHPDWLIVSWELLGGTGSAFIREVRAAKPGTRLVILTDSATAAELAWVKRLQPNSIHRKPVAPESVFLACAPHRVAPVAAG